MFSLRGCFCDFPRCCSYGCTENHRASFSMPHLPVRWCLLLGSVANLPCSFLRARPSPQNPNNVRLPTVHRPLRRGHVRTVGARQASARNLRFRFRFSDVRADSQTFRDCCLKTRSQTWRAKFKISFRNLRHRFGISDRVSESQTPFRNLRHSFGISDIVSEFRPSDRKRDLRFGISRSIPP